VRLDDVLLCPYNTSTVLVGAGGGQGALTLQALLLTAAGIIWRTIRGGRDDWAATVVGNNAKKIPKITTILSTHRE
jgi:hypothetical protein